MDKQIVARMKRAEEVEKTRRKEEDCAWRFLTSRDETLHIESCVFARRGDPACSRNYDPGEEPDRNLYEGTGIGALFGLDGTRHRAHELAGWNVIRGVGDLIP